MTSPALSAVPCPLSADPPVPHTVALPTTSLLTAFAASLGVYFLPRRAGRSWLGITLPKALLIAAFNLFAGLFWALLSASAFVAWLGMRPEGYPSWSSRPHLHFQTLNEFCTFFAALLSTVAQWSLQSFATLALPDKFAGVAGIFLCIVLSLAVLFFLLLPFAARPGANKPCARHVARAALLATSAIHVWGAALTVAFLCFFLRHDPPETDAILSPLFALLSALILWNLAALITAVRTDYRRPLNFPQPREPLCDNCGYNLTMASPTGRCPECGRPVAESLGPDTRPGTPWERRRSLPRLAAIASQLRQIVRSPRALFFQTPTHRGQADAQRWLLGSLVAVGLAAAWIVPGFYLVDYLADHSASLEISWRTFWGAVMMAIVWAGMGLMMVGIETAGVAAFSRMKGFPVPFAASAKVTAFAAPLLLAWVFLGGLQIVLINHFNPVLSTHLSLRAYQVVLALSLGIAHIGGLLWFELTVYRGVRAIQYANK